jgi:hypothetical protein
MTHIRSRAPTLESLQSLRHGDSISAQSTLLPDYLAHLLTSITIQSTKLQPQAIHFQPWRIRTSTNALTAN